MRKIISIVLIGLVSMTIRHVAVAGDQQFIDQSFDLVSAQLKQDERSLYLFNIHTKEEIEVAFWRKGRYNKQALESLNIFLKDWRKQEVIAMDPELLSLLFFIQQTIALKYPHVLKQPIHVISGYRSQSTNNILRAQGRKTSKKSQHILGNAIDVHFPNVPTRFVRDVAATYKRGGVGYYPDDGFVHIDTGQVRQW